MTSPSDDLLSLRSRIAASAHNATAAPRVYDSSYPGADACEIFCHSAFVDFRSGDV